MRSILFIALLLFNTSVTFAEWVYLTPELGAGYSDNVYQDNLYKKSDIYSWLRGSTKYKTLEASYIGRLSLSVYSQQTNNNSISYSLSRSTDISDSLELYLSLGGLSYLQSETASNDEAYNHIFTSGALIKDFECTEVIDCYFEPGIKIQSYPQLDNRLDTTFYSRLDSVWELDSSTELTPFGEIGYVFSNQSYYQKSYFDIGLYWKKNLNSDYNTELGFDLFSSTYPNRVVSDILLNPRPGRGSSTSKTSLTVHESTNLIQLSAKINIENSPTAYSLGTSYTAQTSVSDLYNYNELQIFASAIWKGFN